MMQQSVVLSNLPNLIYLLDIWSNLGHFKGRRVMTTMCAVREAAPLVLKSAKFHSLLTYCKDSPLNWVYCPSGNA